MAQEASDYERVENDDEGLIKELSLLRTQNDMGVIYLQTQVSWHLMRIDQGRMPKSNTFEKSYMRPIMKERASKRNMKALNRRG